MRHAPLMPIPRFMPVSVSTSLSTSLSTSPSTLISTAVRAVCLALGLVTGSSLAASNQFCGGPVLQTGDPSDLAHVVGDQTLEALAEQPASMMVCSKGYLFEKCGDHETALRIFDRCIAAGYVGAMIWKALMLQDGAGTPRDLQAAAELMRRAAQAGDSPYATLGKLHYASALHEGKGVERNEAEARKWFEAAAAEGNPDALEFLATGYHVGDRDGQARGVGVAPPQAQTQVKTGPGPEAGVPLPLPAELREAGPVLARTLSQAPVPAQMQRAEALAPPPSAALGQASGVSPAPVGPHLQAVTTPAQPADDGRAEVVAGLLLLLMGLGSWHQAATGRPGGGRVVAGGAAHV